MTTVFSALPMPKGGRFLRRPDFFGKGKLAEDVGNGANRYFDPDQVDDMAAQDSTEPDVGEFNSALRVLVDVFPDVAPDVFREMLLSLSEESRIEVVTEHLLRDGAKFIQGRYRKAPKVDKEHDATAVRVAMRVRGSCPQIKAALQPEDTFRTDEYKQAVKLAFYQEFRSLSHSTIRAVLAEHNFSYTLARPTLQHVVSKSWRFTLTNLWSRKRANTSDAHTHPLVEWQPDLTGSGLMLPCLVRTKSLELNREIYETLIAPVLAAQRQDLLCRDQVFADAVNQAEAEQVNAMYECECCYASSTFEKVATCDDACHFICFGCIRHAINEALFGQGWARNIDAAKASLRCLAPSLDECHGCLPPDLIRRALCTDEGGEGDQTWHALQDRLAAEALIKSQLPLLRCPFCSYAELDELSSLRFKDPITVAFSARYIPHDPWASLGILAFIIFYSLIFPFLHITVLFTQFVYKSCHARLRNSQAHALRKRRGLRFDCLSASCGRSSCTNCLSSWRDPHTCHADSLQSLRQAVESATTHSIKRVCPKCSLSFVKSSGCNKLVCNCGYVMCYICRQEIGSREGYSHFCQHFRERPGTRCRECDKCDLYVAEDEDRVIKRAAEQAEKDWLNKEAEKTGGDSMPARHRQRYGGVVKDVLRGKKKDSSLDWDALLDAFMATVLA